MSKEVKELVNTHYSLVRIQAIGALVKTSLWDNVFYGRSAIVDVTMGKIL